MKKFVFSIVAILWVIVITGCGKTTTSNVSEDVVSAPETNAEKFEATLQEVYKKWGKVTCTMSTVEAGEKMEWILYLDGKNMRSDVKGSVQWITFEASTVAKDGYAYTRNNMGNEWWKMVFDEEAETSSWSDTSDMNTKMTFECAKGVKDSKVFELPNNIDFKELNF